jgi:hypothetical protein
MMFQNPHKANLGNVTCNQTADIKLIQRHTRRPHKNKKLFRLTPERSKLLRGQIPGKFFVATLGDRTDKRQQISHSNCRPHKRQKTNQGLTRGCSNVFTWDISSVICFFTADARSFICFGFLGQKSFSSSRHQFKNLVTSRRNQSKVWQTGNSRQLPNAGDVGYRKAN